MIVNRYLRFTFTDGPKQKPRSVKIVEIRCIYKAIKVLKQPLGNPMNSIPTLAFEWVYDNFGRDLPVHKITFRL